jgi:hypothetical protein
LLSHTKNDKICLFTNILEFFTALRRLGKKVWLLEYSQGSHSLSGKSADDLDVRMVQFFDYYLKKAPPPKWMTSRLSADGKDSYRGIDLDSTSKTP